MYFKMSAKRVWKSVNVEKLDVKDKGCDEGTMKINLLKTIVGI